MTSKYVNAKSRIIELLQDLRDINNVEIKSVNQIAGIIKEEFSFNEDQDSIRTYVRYINKKYKEDENPDVIKQISDQIGISKNKLGLTWIKGKDFSASVKPNTFDLDKIFDKFESIIKNHKFKRRKLYKINHKEINCNALKTVVSDEHVGMDVSGGLFNYDYDAKLYSEKHSSIFPKIYNKFQLYGKFDIVLLDNYGDVADGWKKMTERGGHSLPQNMEEDEVFETVINARLNLIDTILSENITNKIYLRNVLNSNHAARFDAVINKALKVIVNRFYDKEVIVVDGFKNFLEYREYGLHGFAVTHGKDREYMTRGLPFKLNDTAETFINKYLDSLNTNAKFIHVEKGDLHQIGFEKKKRFDYRNYMSFAPPSAWVQHNFGDTYSGYSIQVIPKYSNEIDHTNYFLDYSLKPNEVVSY